MHPNPLSRSRWIADLCLLAVAAVWGSTFVVVKTATSSFPVLGFLTLRFLVALMVLLPFNLQRLQRRRPFSLWELKWGAAAGALFAGGYIFQTFSLRLTDSGRVGFITGLYVVLVPVLALFLLRYRISRRIVLALILSLIGMVFLGYVPGSSFTGDLLAFLCAVCYAGQILVVEKMPPQSDWRFMALMQSGMVVLICGGLMPILAEVRGCEGTLCSALLPFAETIPTSLPGDVLQVAAYTGILATAAALAVQIWAQKILPPSDAALIFAMEAPFAVVFGLIFLQESLTLTGAFGCALIFAAMLTVTLGTREVKGQPAPA